ncbi:MAG: hypothetical protein IPH20_18400 [Bacteroidales bacterium]|nr:hypothetical protein [Bacteroidales bacterium]
MDLAFYPMRHIEPDLASGLKTGFYLSTRRVLTGTTDRVEAMHMKGY